jgi:hypothetical protein
VQTKFGPRIACEAVPNDDFWSAWRDNKDALKKAGISPRKDDYGNWSVTWWQPLPEEEQQARAAALEASKAEGIEGFNPPAPDGLDYLPFQKAGIYFALRQFGLL